MATVIKLKQLESGSALVSASAIGSDFSASVIGIVEDNLGIIIPEGTISGSSQLDGATLKNITLAPSDSDQYSLIISGALAVVDATNLPNGAFGDNDTNVPAQIWVNGDGINPPTDPSISGSAQANIIDQGEW